MSDGIEKGITYAEYTDGDLNDIEALKDIDDPQVIYWSKGIVYVIPIIGIAWSWFWVPAGWTNLFGESWTDLLTTPETYLNELPSIGLWLFDLTQFVRQVIYI